MSQFISLSEAIALTTRYRQNRESILLPEYRNQGLLLLSESFSRADVEALLAHEGCAGLRVYPVMFEDLRVSNLLVAIDESGNDILPPSSLTATEEDDYLLEHGIRCPDICPADSPLNN